MRTPRKRPNEVKPSLRVCGIFRSFPAGFSGRHLRRAAPFAQSALG
jgi:hypothetical protein